MFFRRRPAEDYDDEEPEEPQRAPRGKGGGKLRIRPKRKATRRRKMGASDLAMYGLLGFVLVFLVEHFLFKQPYLAALLAAVFSAVLLVIWTAFMEGRRQKRDAARQRPTTRKR